MNLWTDPSFIDTVTTAQASQWVFVTIIDKVPQPPEIGDDGMLRSFARLILCRDIVARLEAFSPYDFSGDQLRAAGLSPPSAIGNEAGVLHGAYEVVRAGYPLDASLSALIAGKTTITIEGREVPLTVPNAWTGGDLFSATMLVPRGVHGTIGHFMDRAPSGSYSPPRNSATLLNQLRVVRQAASVAADTGLAATAAATWTAARADLLAQAQAVYPERGYT